MRGTNIKDLKKDYGRKAEGNIPDELKFSLTRVREMKYGENPNQAAGLFAYGNSHERMPIEVLGGGDQLSATNWMDVLRSLDVVKTFTDTTVAVMKHNIPSGFATSYGKRSQLECYALARDADARSAYGSVILVNKSLDKDTAKEITSTFVVGVVAPGFEEGAMGVLQSKEGVRVWQYDAERNIPAFTGDAADLDIRTLPGGYALVQQQYLSDIRGKEELILDAQLEGKKGTYTVPRDPTEAELKDMLTAWNLSFGVRSNSIVLLKDGVSLAVGTGQLDRIGALEFALIKAYHTAMRREGISFDPLNGALKRDELSYNPLEGAVLASDGFLPFRDSVDLAHAHGITAIIQPGGSKKDVSVIKAVQEHNMAMAITALRCFKHF